MGLKHARRRTAAELHCVWSAASKSCAWELLPSLVPSRTWTLRGYYELCSDLLTLGLERLLPCLLMPGPQDSLLLQVHVVCVRPLCVSQTSGIECVYSRWQEAGWVNRNTGHTRGLINSKRRAPKALKQMHSVLFPPSNLTDNLHWCPEAWGHFIRKACRQTASKEKTRGY